MQEAAVAAEGRELAGCIAAVAVDQATTTRPVVALVAPRGSSRELPLRIRMRWAGAAE